MRRYSWTILLSLLAILCVGGCRTQTTLHGLVFEPPRPAPTVMLTDQHGHPFSLDQQRGKVVLLYFGFTQCPDLCPTTLAELSNVMRDLGGLANRVQVVLITVDPERDTPERMGNYVGVFHPSFLGLTGPRAAIDPIIQAYGVTAIKRELPNSALGYTVDHSSFIYVIDTEGRWRQQFVHGTPKEHIVNDLRTLLRGGRL